MQYVFVCCCRDALIERPYLRGFSPLIGLTSSLAVGALLVEGPVLDLQAEINFDFLIRRGPSDRSEERPGRGLPCWVPIQECVDQWGGYCRY